MRRTLVAIACVLSSVFVAVPSGAAAPTTTGPSGATTLHSPALAATPANLQAFSGPSACGQHPGMPNCAIQMRQGLMLFAWSCTGCDSSWLAVFVVNGQASTPSDINIGPSKLLALSVRAKQFKSSDCVAVRVYDPSYPTHSATSNAVCLSRVLTGTRPPSATNPSVLQSGSTSNNTILHGPIGQTLSTVPTPAGMSATHDQAACAAHGGFGGGLACLAGLQNGMLALIWTCNNCAVDGYRVYRIDGQSRTLLPANGAYATDATVTLDLLVPPSDGFNGKCYAVTAFKGPIESALSTVFCAGLSSTARTVTLSPTHTLLWGHSDNYVNSHSTEEEGGMSGGIEQKSDGYSDSALAVGYANYYMEGGTIINYFTRSALVFDLSSLAGHSISKAMLAFSAQSYHSEKLEPGLHGGNYVPADSGTDACVAYIDVATGPWWTSHVFFISTTAYLAPGGFVGPNVTVDVTSPIVNGGAIGTDLRNFGFILRGDSEDEYNIWYSNTPQHICMTTLQSTSLVVTYY